MSGIFPDSGVPANQALNTVDVDTTNCGGAGGELFHSTNRCTPRFDPAAANAMMSELLNAVTKKCDGTDSTQVYNCNRLDNLLTAICRHWDDKWSECFEGDVPAAGTVCGDVRYLVLVNDGDCTRFATYSSSDPSRGQGTFAEAQPQLPAEQGGFTAPGSFTNPTNLYNYDQLRAHYLANTINEARIQNSKLTRATISLDCATRLEPTTLLNIRQPSAVADAYNQRLRIGFRWRTNGGAWQYPTVAGEFTTGTPINALQSGSSFAHGGARVFGPGTVEMETFYLLDGDGSAPGVVLNASTHTGAGGVPSPRTVISPAL